MICVVVHMDLAAKQRPQVNLWGQEGGLLIILLPTHNFTILYHVLRAFHGLLPQGRFPTVNGAFLT